MPKQAEMILPLLASLEEVGGAAPIKKLYDHVAQRMNLSDEDRTRRIPHPGRPNSGSTINAFEYATRWAAQQAKHHKLVRPTEARDWVLTGKGEDRLRNARPGLVLTIYIAEDGAILWADTVDAMTYVDDSSVQLLLTSPPYPLLREKQYGNLPEREYIDWMLRLAETWPRKLTGDGSILLNLGDAYLPGIPAHSLYQERLLIELADKVGLRLCQRFAWLNPSKMPAPAIWVTQQRVRVKSGLEQCYWLSPHDQPYANNRSVLNPYSDAMLKVLARGGEKAQTRPSGHNRSDGAFGADQGGSIPDNLLVASNTESNSDYIRACKAAGLPVHPARFPAALPEFFIKLATRAGDTVLDPFFGSGTTGMVARRLGRRFIGIEKALDYAEGAAMRMRNTPFPEPTLALAS